MWKALLVSLDFFTCLCFIPHNTVLSKVASSTSFWVFGTTGPGIEPLSPRPLVNSLPTWPMGWLIHKVYAHTHTHTHTCIMYAHIYMYINTHTHTHIYIYVYVHTYMCMHTHAHISLSIYLYILLKNVDRPGITSINSVWTLHTV